MDLGYLASIINHCGANKMKISKDQKDKLIDIISDVYCEGYHCGVSSENEDEYNDDIISQIVEVFNNETEN